MALAGPLPFSSFSRGDSEHCVYRAVSKQPQDLSQSDRPGKRSERKKCAESHQVHENDMADSIHCTRPPADPCEPGWDSSSLAVKMPAAGTSDHIGELVREVSNSRLDDLYPCPTNRLVMPFQRWLDSLRRRAVHNGGPSEEFADAPEALQLRSARKGPRSQSPRRHQARLSTSSSACVHAVQSTNASLADDICGRSGSRLERAGPTGPSLRTRGRASNRLSCSSYRVSEEGNIDSHCAALDLAASERSTKRQQIVRELVETEEGYVDDLKFLLHFFVTIQASTPSRIPGFRSSVRDNLTDIIELHVSILASVRQLASQKHNESLAIQPTRPTEPSLPANHRRWTCFDLPSVPQHLRGLAPSPPISTDPQYVVTILRIFDQQLHELSLYDEYAAKYEMMLQECVASNVTCSERDAYQRGLEVLASVIASPQDGEFRSKRSLTAADLLVKPIQRICRYPLLFLEILKHTPVVDCPTSHLAIADMHCRLRQLAAGMNQATTDQRLKSVLKSTWLLRHRLVFPASDKSANRYVRLHSFGHTHLCGVLHVSWQTRRGVDGKYMICVLYRDFLCLAVPEPHHDTYAIKACIELSDLRMESADNGRGLQCHSAPHSWKVIFFCKMQLFEMIMTACSDQEEAAWKGSLVELCGGRIRSPAAESMCCMDLDMKSLGQGIGKQGVCLQQLSIQRAMTVCPKIPLCQVIIRNTCAAGQNRILSENRPVYRSRSFQASRERVPILTLARSDRARLVSLLADVWTRDSLPFPGVPGASRGEQLVRTSASTVLRKLSVSSLASFTRRQSPPILPRRESERPGRREASEGHDTLWEATTRSHRVRQAKSDFIWSADQASPIRTTTKADVCKVVDMSEDLNSIASTSKLWVDHAEVLDPQADVSEFPELSLLLGSSVESLSLAGSLHSYDSANPLRGQQGMVEDPYATGRAAEPRGWGKFGLVPAEGKRQAIRSLFR